MGRLILTVALTSNGKVIAEPGDTVPDTVTGGALDQLILEGSVVSADAGDTPEPYAGLKKPELVKLATEAGIPDPEKLKVEELRTALTAAATEPSVVSADAGDTPPPAS